MDGLRYKTEIEDLRSMPLFCHCSEKELVELLRHPHNRQAYKQGDVIVGRGDFCHSLMLLMTGRVSMHVTGSLGKTLVVERIAAPQILHLSGLLNGGQVAAVDCVADSECCVWRMSRNGFLSLMMLNGGVSLCVVRSVADHNGFLVGRMKALATETLEVRVVDYLDEYGEIRNVSAVAAVLGVARPSLSRTINTMVRDGVLRRVSGNVIVLAR